MFPSTAYWRVRSIETGAGGKLAAADAAGTAVVEDAAAVDAAVDAEWGGLAAATSPDNDGGAANSLDDGFAKGL